MLPYIDHKAVFLPGSNEIIMYGGIGYDAEQPITYSDTFSAIVKGMLFIFIFLEKKLTYFLLCNFRLSVFLCSDWDESR